LAPALTTTSRPSVADHGRLADDDAHAVVDEDALADDGAGVDLDAGEPAADVRDEAPQPLEAMVPAPVRRALQPDRMQTRITGDDLPGAACRRVAVEDALDIGAQAVKHLGAGYC